MSITLSDQYYLFKDRLEGRIADAELALVDTRRNIEYNLKFIERMKEKYPDAFSNLELDDLNVYNTSNNKAVLAKLKKYKRSFRLDAMNKVMASNMKELIDNYKLLSDKVAKLLFYKGLIKKIKNESYRGIIQNANFEIVRIILKGDRYRFGSGLGSIKIYGVERTIQRAIDWGSTMKYKQALIDEGHEIYNKKDNPDGVKWHVLYDLGIHYWWIWTRNSCTYSNKRFYTFIPTKYINRDVRLKEDFLKDIKEPDDIINSIEIGNVHKMQYLLDHFKNYHLNYELLCTT